MARELRRFTATIPAGTAIANPVTVPLTLPVRVVSSIDWRIPGGPLGTMGFRLAMGKVQVIPTPGDLWVIEDSTSGTFTLTDFPTSGAWSLVGYNTGQYAHSIFLTFHCDLVVAKKPPRVMLDAIDLSPAPDLSRAGAPIRRLP